MKFGNWNIKIFKEKINEEIGSSGTSFFQGFLAPEEYLTELTGTAGLTVYDKMRKSDGVVKAALLACELPIRAANWYVEPASEEDGDKEIADFISYNLFEAMTITWDDFLRQALLCLPLGFSCFEKVFQPLEFEGKEMIGWKKFAPRLQKTIFKWQTEDNQDGVVQLLPTGGTVSIPIEKLLIFVHQKEGDNWYGIPTLRNAYRSWYYKNHIEKINAMAFDRQGLGIPMMEIPINATADDKKMADELLKNIRANEQCYLRKPEGWKFEFVDMKAGTLRNPDETIRRCNWEILISVLAQFLHLGSGQAGSWALGDIQSTTFHNNLVATAKQIKDGLNKYAIKQLVDLNYNVKKYPTLKYSYIGMPPIKEITEALGILIAQGAVKNDGKLEDYLRQLLNLPPRPEEEPEDESEEVKKTPKQKTLKPEKPENPEEDEIESEKKKASEFFGYRKMTFAEHKVNFPDIKRKLDIEQKKLKKKLDEILGKSANDLIRQLQMILESTDNAEKRNRLKEMEIKYQGEYRKEIYDTIKEMFQYGKMMAAHEMVKDVPATPAASLSLMSQLADTLTLTMSDDLMRAGKLALLEELKKKQFSEALKHIIGSVEKAAEKIALSAAAINVGSSLNQGRRATQVVYQDDIYALQRSELLDDVTCNFCLSIDGRVFKKNDPFTKNDIFHSNCRGIFVEILKTEEEKPEIAGIPQSLRDSFDNINVLEPLKNPIVRKDSLAAEYLGKKAKIDIIYQESVLDMKTLYDRADTEIIEKGKLKQNLVDGRINDIVQKLERSIGGGESESFLKQIKGEKFRDYKEFEKVVKNILKTILEK